MTVAHRLAPLAVITVALGLWAAPVAVAQQAPACEAYSTRCAPSGGTIGGGSGGPGQLSPEPTVTSRDAEPATSDPAATGGGGSGQTTGSEQISGGTGSAGQLPASGEDAAGGGVVGRTADRPRALPFTGQDLALAAVLGASALGAGAVVLLAARRRQA